MKSIDKKIKDYIEDNVLPLYNDNIGGHGKEHILSVIDRSFEIMEEFKLNVNPNIVYVAAAYHDIGYKDDPDNHEQVSSLLFLADKKMQSFFTLEEIKLISEAIVDHRASLEYEARSVYGKIVSSADRAISVEGMLTRSLCYQKDKHKDENPSLNQVIEYSYKKLYSKYSTNGYAKMYYPDKKYKDYLQEMQSILEDFELFKKREVELARKINLYSE